MRTVRCIGAFVLLLSVACGRNEGRSAAEGADSGAVLGGNASTEGPDAVLQLFILKGGGKVGDKAPFLFNGRTVTGRKYLIPALHGKELQALFDALEKNGFAYVEGAETECQGIKNYSNDGYVVSLRYKRSACRTAVNVSFGIDVYVAGK